MEAFIADAVPSDPSAERAGEGRFTVHVISDAGDSEALLSARADVERYRLLSHPALPPVLEVLQLDDAFAVVMPYEDGVKLDGLRRFLAADKEQFPDPAVWFVGWRLFGALATAHLARNEHGLLMPLIHGALTMNRMLVTAQGELRVHGFCAVLDYDDEEEDTATTRSSIVPQAWWAPEVRQGNTAQPPSDVYSAALILRSLLAGLPQPIPGASIQPLADARPDLPRDITDALDRAVLRSGGGTDVPSAADLSHRFEGIARVSDGKRALRATLELERALGGLWSIAAPALWEDEPPSERAPELVGAVDPVSPEELVLEDSVLDEAALLRLNLLSDEASPESLMILDEATSDVAAEMDSLIALESDGSPEDAGAEEEPPQRVRRPTPPPLPRTELVADESESEQFDPEPLSEIPDGTAERMQAETEPAVDSSEGVDFGSESVPSGPPSAAPPSGVAPLSEEVPFSEIPETEPEPVADDDEPVSAQETTERARRDSAAPIELNRLAAPVLGDGDDLGPLDGTLDDTQPDIEPPRSSLTPSPFLLPKALLTRAQSELQRQSTGDSPRVEVLGHFEVQGDPDTDAIGEEVHRLAPRKRKHRTMQEARDAAGRPDSAPPPPRAELKPFATADAKPLASPADDEEPGWSRWLVFAAVALTVGVAAWYGSRPSQPDPVPVVVVDDAPDTASPPTTSSAGDTRAVVESAHPPAPPPSPPEPAAPSEEPLMSYEGFLTIESSVDAEVYLKGNAVGNTNEKNRVRCGDYKHIRLRHKSPSPDRSPWLTVGKSIPVPCMKSTTHRIEPDIE